MGNDVDVAAGVTPTLDLRAPRCASPSAQLHERGLLISAVVIVTRLVWQNTIVFLIRAIDRRPHLVAERTTWRLRTGRRVGRHPWCGLAGGRARPAGRLPPARPPGLPDFCVIAVTLVGQGLTLPYVIRKLGVSDDGRAEKEELKVRLMATKAAIRSIDELGGAEWTHDDTVVRLRGVYEYRQRRLAARAGMAEDDGYEDRSCAYRPLRPRGPRSATRRAGPPPRRRHDLGRGDAQARAGARPRGSAPQDQVVAAGYAGSRVAVKSTAL